MAYFLTYSASKTAVETSAEPLVLLLNFIILDPKSNHGIDTEDMKPYETKVHGYSAILFAKEDDSESAILINFEDCAVFVHGNVTQNEMRDIADNIKIKNWK